jgi:hypothetical protein
MNYGLHTAVVLTWTLTLQVATVQASSPVTGAIFTTVADGTIVNANIQYNSKCDAYLDGGPGPNAPAHAAGLPAGDYFFQVTDASGKTLLNTDVVSNRRFTVSTSGVIVAYTGVGGLAHPTGIDQDHPELGAITIRLANSSCPADFLDTPNSGGVYKAWVTPVADFVGDPTQVDNPCSGGCFHGFVSSKSKTDNFKAKPTIATFCLTVAKQLVDSLGNITGPGLNWQIDITDSLGVVNTFFTDSVNGQLLVCDLAAGGYTVSEVMQDGWKIFGLIANGVTLPPQPVYSFTWTAGAPAPNVIFQNTPVVIIQ